MTVRVWPSVPVVDEERLRRGPSCTCDPRFFPAACDVDCPEHGLATYLRERLEADAQRGGEIGS